MLEECELEYNLIPVDIGGGDQFKPEFLAYQSEQSHAGDRRSRTSRWW